VTTHAHDYGIYWLEQTRAGVFAQRLIADAWSQAHAMTLQDLTGDGYTELISSKRLYAHNGHDAGGREPLGVYWYERFENGATWEWARPIILNPAVGGSSDRLYSVEIKLFIWQMSNCGAVEIFTFRVRFRR